MPEPAVVVRRGGVDDAPVLGRLLFDFNTEFDTETDSAEILADRFARLLPRDDVLTVLAEDGGPPLGFALLTLRPAIWFDGPVTQLEELYVVPSLRDRGIGTAILDEARAGSPSRRAARRCTSTSTRSTTTPGASTNATASATSRTASTTGCSATSARRPEPAARRPAHPGGRGGRPRPSRDPDVRGAR